MSEFAKGILFSVCAAALFTPVLAAGKFADGAFSALALVTIRYVGGFVTILMVVLVSRTSPSQLRSPNPLHHVVRASLGAAGGMSFIYAGSVIPIAYATAIGLTRGIFVILLAGLVLHEVILKRHWIACFISIAGALLTVAQSFESTALPFSGLAGVIAALMGAVFIAVEVLFVRVISQSEKALTILLYTNGFGALILTGICVFNAAVLDFWRVEALPFLTLGPIAILGQYCNIKAYRLINASVLAPVSYSIIIFSTFLGIFAFDEVPTVAGSLGGALIVLGGVVATLKVKCGSRKGS